MVVTRESDTEFAIVITADHSDGITQLIQWAGSLTLDGSSSDFSSDLAMDLTITFPTDMYPPEAWFPTELQVWLTATQTTEKKNIELNEIPTETVSLAELEQWFVDSAIPQWADIDRLVWLWQIAQWFALYATETDNAIYPTCIAVDIPQLEEYLTEIPQDPQWVQLEWCEAGEYKLISLAEWYVLVAQIEDPQYGNLLELPVEWWTVEFVEWWGSYLWVPIDL